MQENTNYSQKLTLENRKTLSITGVTDVEASNDNIIKLNTNFGKLSIFGNNLKINSIDLKTGDFTATRTKATKTRKRKTSDKSLSRLISFIKSQSSRSSRSRSSSFIRDLPEMERNQPEEL